MAEYFERNFKSEVNDKGTNKITKRIPSIYIDPVVMGVSAIKPNMASMDKKVKVWCV